MKEIDKLRKKLSTPELQRSERKKLGKVFNAYLKELDYIVYREREKE